MISIVVFNFFATAADVHMEGHKPRVDNIPSRDSIDVVTDSTSIRTVQQHVTEPKQHPSISQAPGASASSAIVIDGMYVACIGR